MNPHQITDEQLLNFLKSFCLPCQISRKSVYYKAQQHFFGACSDEQFDRVFDGHLDELMKTVGTRPYFNRFTKEFQKRMEEALK